MAQIELGSGAEELGGGGHVSMNGNNSGNHAGVSRAWANEVLD